MIRTVLVTGASSGIGLATVLHVSHLGFEAVGLVSDTNAEQALRREAARRSKKVRVVVADLADPAARAALGGDIEPWALVNNAGYINAGQIRDVPLSAAREQMEVMVMAPADLSRQVLPAMVARGQGRIVNVTSAALHTATPLAGWYAAAKAALREINDSLRLELRDTGVDVIDVEPGGYRTGIWGRAALELTDRRATSSQADLYDRALRRLAGTRRFGGDPDEVARVIGDLLTVGTPPAHRRVGPGAGWLRSLDVVVPERLWDKAAAGLARTGHGSPV